MKKSFHLGLYEHFDPVRTADSLVHLKQGVTMPNAEASYWKQQDEEAVLQEFDGHYGFLYYIDVRLDRQRHIPVEVDRADMHILYVLQSPGQTRLYDTDVRPVCQLDSQRAVYLYLPPEEYSLCLPRGRTRLFGFYFRAKIFRRGNERPYDFLRPLLEAYRTGSGTALSTADFSIGLRTRFLIETLCRDIRPKELRNESFIMDKLTRLIALSRETILPAATRAERLRRTAERARELLALYVERDGQSVQLSQIAADLGESLTRISRKHKQYFGQTLQKHREELLLARACDLLHSGLSPTECAYALNYNSPESFFHFFKAKMGLSPLTYLKTQ
ncbi:AraC-like DNA-binding protein [Sphingobacterium allocomposti]|uniref:AraC-like DNA-binding protein n=1 Tax=Sphingobacterium allocomposti TaxID=415956 RepID=A0A5S5D9E2_9SPHI|nr:helix-turn-helix domain-containing protein [Sphingobacterium composti Yoo et al. 2007 non Ten et al. 2007]TYP91342.1 AraC-like DNA-binding protein [Sphingobacterium composti Yoo et al. 2007 non Ten et al. 2007]